MGIVKALWRPLQVVLLLTLATSPLHAAVPSPKAHFGFDIGAAPGTNWWPWNTKPFYGGQSGGVVSYALDDIYYRKLLLVKAAANIAAGDCGSLNALMRAMFDGGLSADLVHHGMHALSTRMWGFTRDVMPMPTAPADPAARAAAISAFFTAYPSIGRMSTTAPHAGDGCDDDAEFAFALDLLLEGLAARHASGWTSAP